MNDLFDMLKLLAIVWLILIAMLGLPFVLVKIVLVCSSDSGLWTEYPHSGFCPEAPRAIAPIDHLPLTAEPPHGSSPYGRPVGRPSCLTAVGSFDH